MKCLERRGTSDQGESMDMIKDASFAITRWKAENMGSKFVNVKMWEVSSDLAITYETRSVVRKMRE